MKTDKLLKLIQQKKAMRSGGALPLPRAQSGIVNQNAYNLWYKYNTPEGRANIPDVYSDYDYKKYFEDAVTGVNPMGFDEESMHFPDTYKYPWHPSFSDESIYYVNQKETPGLSYQTKRNGGLAKAQKGLQFVPNGTYGNYYDPSTGQYIPQVHLPDVNIVADRELPFQNGKFAPFLAAKGMVENDALSDPIALAAALTAGGVGLGTIGLSQIPRVFARNLASEATAGVSDFVRNKLAKTASQLDLEELRRVYHNSERFLQPDEARHLFKHGHGLRENYITNKPGYFDWGTDRWNAASQSSPLPSSEQLPPPPEDIWGVAEGPTFNPNLLQTSDEPKKVFNRSGLTKDEVLQKASVKDKNAVSEMSETEFENTVLKPDGEIVEYRPGPSIDQMTYDPKTRKMVLRDQTILSEKEYADEFNSQLDLLNEIIAQKNKTGVEYKVKSLDPYGNLIFETPSQGNIERNWAVKINPGKWRGDVEDIVNTEYYRSVPGLEMSNTAIPVFGDMQPRRGSGTYEAINEYLKRLDLGRVKAGFNSQTDLSRGAWENFIKSGRGFGFYANPRTVHGIMKTIVPGAIGAGALQQIEEQQIGGSSNMKTDKLLQLITNANPRFQKGGGLNDLVVSEMWEKLTGTKWSQAKKLGLTDGSYEKNLQLRNMLAEEAAKPKPNMGKFTGRGTPQVPKASAATRNLTAAALQQTATPRASTAVNMPVVSAPVAPVAKKPGSRPAMTKEQMAQALDQARGINPAAQSTLTVAQPVIQTPVGRMPMPAEKPVLVPVTPPMGQPTYPQQAEESGSMFPNLSRMATASMLNILPVVGGVQAANLYGPMMARNAAAGLYDATIGPEIDYLTDPNSAVLPNFVRAALPLPLNAANSLSYLMRTGMAMDDRSLSDEEKRVIYETAINASKKGKSSFTYEDFANQGQGDADLYNQKLKRGKIGFLDAVRESFTNPAFNIASTIGGSNFEFLPDGTLKVVNVSDWNPEDANFSNPNSPYQYYRNFLRNVNRNRIKNMTPEERAAEDKKNTISLTIPSSIMQEQKAGGAKRSLKIRIRKNG